jgi:HSP20 family molecular chaperone IbpA
MAQQPRYKSEVYIPIQKDDKSFEERQKSIWDEINSDLRNFGGGDRSIWDDMHLRMDSRRREWDAEVDRMRKDFFRLKPSESRKDSSDNLLEKMDLDNIFCDDVKKGDKKFRVSFDVSQFSPEEISVRTQDSKLIVHAKHEEKGSGKNVSREFSRQVDIPRHVDPDKLSCTLSNDGVLQVEAPVPAPAYDRIRTTAPATQLSHEAPRNQPRLIPSTSGPHQQPRLIPSTSGPQQPRLIPSTSGPQQPRLIPSSTPPPSSSFRSGPIVTEQDGSRKLKIEVDIGREFGPEDIMVKTVDKKLVVHAKHEEKAAGRTSFREFSREFELPEDVDPNTVQASITDDGKLQIEAPISSYQKGSYQGQPGSTKQPTITLSMRK